MAAFAFKIGIQHTPSRSLELWTQNICLPNSVRMPLFGVLNLKYTHDSDLRAMSELQLWELLTMSGLELFGKLQGSLERCRVAVVLDKGNGHQCQSRASPAL